MKIRVWVCCSILFLALPALPAQAQFALGWGFTCQGQLVLNGVPVNGPTTLRFSLWDAAGAGSPPTGGNKIGATQIITKRIVVLR